MFFGSFYVFLLLVTTDKKSSTAVNIGRMTIAGLDFKAEAEYEHSGTSPSVAVCADT